MADINRLVLASTSPARNRLLRSAGLEFEPAAPDVDEDEIRAELAARDVRDPGEIALQLAGRKALAVSSVQRDALVIGGDQVLVIDGEILTKPESRDGARDQLMRLRGRTHMLLSAVASAAGDDICWSATGRARLTMREFSTGFLERYLAAMGERVTSTVGAYEIEGPGIQLFSEVEGDLFTIQGLPLLELLAYLRSQGLAEA